MKSKKNLLFIIFYFFLSCSQKSQFNPISKQLPVLIINTFEKAIVDEPKITASLKIFKFFNFKNLKSSLMKKPDFRYNIGIEIRGQSSKKRVKKSYAIEIRDKQGKDKDVSLLGMPAESDWVLYGPYADKSLIRNSLIYFIARQMGMPASRFRFVEVFINSGKEAIKKSDYKGVYVLIEKIKRGKNRINIKKLKSRHNNEPKISGGYILKIDKLSPNDTYFITKAKTRIIFHYPKSKRITKMQRTWIENYVNKFEKSLLDKKPANLKNEYRKYFDVDSAIDFFILNEFAMNRDAFNLSTFLYKQREQKIKMGPIWDFDLAMGNFLFDSPHGWATRYYKWPKEFFKDSLFIKKLKQRWFSLRKNILSIKNIKYQIDYMSYCLKDAKERNFKKWPILDKNIWQRKKDYPKKYEDVIAFLNNWLKKRLIWMDKQIARLKI